MYSTECYDSSGDSLYSPNPCCSLLGSWRRTCVPSLIEINVTHANNTNLQVVNNQCNSPSCVLSYLEDYKGALNSISLNNECRFDINYFRSD